MTPCHRFPVDPQESGLRFVGEPAGHWSVWTHSVVKLYEELREYRTAATSRQSFLARGAAVTDCNGVFFDPWRTTLPDASRGSMRCCGVRA